MSRRPKVVDMDTGEELFPNLPVIPKGPSSGPLIPSTNTINNNSGGMSGFDVEGAKAVVDAAKSIWDLLTPKQKEKVKKVAAKAPREAISNLQYIPEAFSALGKIFFPSKRSSRGAGKDTSQNLDYRLSRLINTNGGKFTIINEPSSEASGGKPSPRAPGGRGKVLF